MFEIGMQVKLKDMGYLGKATSLVGTVVGMRGEELRIKREGVKTPKWYCVSKTPGMPGVSKTPGMPIWVPLDAPEPFRESIRSNPWDWTAYLAYADFLEENGNAKLSHAWRWMGRRQKKPMYNGMSGLSKRWIWMNDWGGRFGNMTTYDVAPAREHQAAELPVVLLLAVSRNVVSTDRQAFQTDDQAIEALARGLHTLQEIAS